MGIHQFHTTLLILLDTLIGLGSYGLIIRFICSFLALARLADGRRSHSSGGPDTLFKDSGL
jgi:hypothetical protein